MGVDDAQVLGAAIAGVGAQMLASANGRALALDDDGAEHSVQSLAVIDVGRGHDDRQRDATAVHQQMAVAPIFSPDPSGWARRLPAQAGPSSLRRPRFAIARRCPPCRRTRPVRLSKALRKSQPSPTRGSACGLRWRCQSAPRQCLPLTPRAQHVHDAFEDQARRLGRPPGAGLAKVLFARRPHTLRHQRLHPLPELIRHLPRLHSLGHGITSSPRPSRLRSTF